MLFADQGLAPDVAERFAFEDARANLGRVIAAVPLLVVLHVVHVVALGGMPRGSDANTELWRDQIIASHAVMAAFIVLVGVAGIWARARLDPLSHRPALSVGVALVIGYLAFAAWVAGVDQLVTTNITPYVIAAFATGIFLPLPALALTLGHLAGFLAFLLAGLTHAHPSPAELSNLLNGGTVALTGWTVSRALRSSRARHLEQAMAIEAHKTQLAAMNAELRRLADLDPLTGLPNRRSLFERAERMRAHAKRHGEPLSLLLIDVDRFKQVNDESGHARGDEVLLAIVEAVRREVRADDLFARIGGEEFVALLAHCPASRAAEVAERMRARVEGLALHHPIERCVTISIGVSALEPAAERAFDEALERADRSLYAAKRDGRNRVGPVGPVGPSGRSG